MKTVNLIYSFVVFLFVYSAVSTIMDMFVKDSYTDAVYTMRRLVQLLLFIGFLCYCITKYNIKLSYDIKVTHLVIYSLLLFSCIIVYENTIEVFLNNIFTPDRASVTRESEISELSKYPVSFFIQICVSAPIFEEIFIRGILFEVMREKGNIYISVLLCNLVFVLLHFDSINTLFYLMISIILTYVYSKTDSIMYCIIMHASVNLYAYIGVYFGNFQKILLK